MLFLIYPKPILKLSLRIFPNPFFRFIYISEQFHINNLRPLPFIIGYSIAFFFSLLWILVESYQYWSFDVKLNQNSLKGLEKFIGEIRAICYLHQTDDIYKKIKEK